MSADITYLINGIDLDTELGQHWLKGARCH
jgi:hypothetical protein